MSVWTTPERGELRATVRRFAETEILPHLDDWERQGRLPRWLHKRAGELGLLGIGFPTEVGGSGGDLVDVVTMVEELHYAGISGGAFASLFTSGIALPHLAMAADPTQVQRWVRPTLAGDTIGALAVTEPGGGSDVAHLRTRAAREGEYYRVNGAKTFITSGCRADFVVAAVRTDGSDDTTAPDTDHASTGAGELSLLVVETDTPGFHVDRSLEKLGWHASDTAQLAFTDCRVPVANRVGAENSGFAQLATAFHSERLSLAVQAYASAQRCLDLAVAWCRERETFGRVLLGRQTVRHTLTEMARHIDVARVYVRHVAERVAAGEADLVAETCFAKNTAVATGEWVVREAQQLFGGLGYMRDSEVERQYRDMRILAIGGGTSEILTGLAARQLGYHP
ncbi:acyl-CoA dehydrogenase family protein [Lipingzhangella sp. LS1_29]|uniref:Acyl-CoA dehydrogenase family protein n=1 Tax=Lipingzhangella rawalii TaxID=2055835 RepID=A0ABU2H5E5_9ACTN|nr:acyl-CoA dehydrogenase family protein [Lipingzhangella rawalii]MDS1270520.1 acyl-CoA dehydrogenase family protein [Lipingzhangella rawalii]